MKLIFVCACIALFGAFVAGGVFESSTFNAWSLVLKSGILGAILALVSLHYWPAKTWRVKTDATSRRRFITQPTLALLCFVMTVPGAFLLNAQFPKGAPTIEKLPVLEKTSFEGKSGMQYVVVVAEEGNKERIGLSYARWQKVQIRDFAVMPVWTGCLGYRFFRLNQVKIFQNEWATPDHFSPVPP